MKKITMLLLLFAAQQGKAQFYQIDFKSQFMATDTPSYFYVFPYQQDSAWLLYYAKASAAATRVYRTANKGQTWQNTNISREGGNSFFAFFPQNGQKLARLEYTGKISVSDNAGQSWDSVGGITPAYYSNHGVTLYRKDDTLMLFTSLDTLRLTTNRGANWQTFICPFKTYLEFFHVVNARVAYAYGVLDSSIYKTSNSGATWTKIWTYPANQTMSKNFQSNWGKHLSAPKEGLVFAFLSERVFRIENDGQTWSMIKKHVKPPGISSFRDEGIHFINRDTGFAHSYDYFIRTLNGGQTWEYFPQLQTVGMNFQDMAFAPGGQVGYISLFRSGWASPARILNMGGAGTPDTLGTGTGTGWLPLPDEADLTVYPVPATNNITVSSQNQPLRQLELMNLQGQVMAAYNLNDGNPVYEKELNLLTLVPGIYLLRIQLKDGSLSNRKVIKIN